MSESCTGNNCWSKLGNLTNLALQMAQQVTGRKKQISYSDYIFVSFAVKY